MLKAADYRARARESLKGKWGMSVLVCLVGALLGGISTGIPISIDYSYNGLDTNFEIYGIPVEVSFLSSAMAALFVMIFSAAAIYSVIQSVIGGAVELGMCAYFSKCALGLDADIQDEFAYFKYFGKAFGLRVVMSLFISLWSILFVIPGIIASYRYAMAPYLMAEHPEMGIMEAINESKRMMNGNKWALFCLDFSFLGWSILSIFTLGIGKLFLNPYTQMATAHFYLTLTRGQKKDDIF